ncbi:MAG: hypothetical protein HQK63_08745 [Desulfamplus sp.]|nr:hypothetical protein [Desulfamplus sp.]
MIKHRDILYNEIKKGMIGPGADYFGLPDEEEIISDYPLNRYYSGILFPLKDYNDNSGYFPKSEEEIEESITQAETDEDDYINSLNQDKSIEIIENELSTELNTAEDDVTQNNSDSSNKSDDRDLQIASDVFFPNHIGLTFCIGNIKSIEVNFSFGIYDQLQIPSPKIKIAISKEGFDSFFDPAIDNQLTFKEALSFDNC